MSTKKPDLRDPAYCKKNRRKLEALALFLFRDFSGRVSCEEVVMLPSAAVFAPYYDGFPEDRRHFCEMFLPERKISELLIRFDRAGQFNLDGLKVVLRCSKQREAK